MSNILIIEDDDEWRESVRGAIDVDNYDLVEAASLDEAKSKLRSRVYDLLIVDIHLSNSKLGIERNEFRDLGRLIFYIRNSTVQPNGRIPIIILTGRNFSREEIAYVLNVFPGWIWGWHEKSTFDDITFHNNITAALDGQKN